MKIQIKKCDSLVDFLIGGNKLLYHFKNKQPAEFWYGNPLQIMGDTRELKENKRFFIRFNKWLEK